MSLFNTNLLLLARQMIPVPLQRPLALAWTKAIALPLGILSGRMQMNRENDYYDLQHNGQVCKLVGVLNDAFDGRERRIYIDDTYQAEPLWIRRRAEALPVFIRRRTEQQPVYIYRRSEVSYGPAFTVWVPAALAFDVAHMRALVNKYRLPSSVFTIKTF